MKLEFDVYQIKDNKLVKSETITTDINNKQVLSEVKQLDRLNTVNVRPKTPEGIIVLLQPIARKSKWTAEMVRDVHKWKLEGLSDRKISHKVFEFHKQDVPISAITRTLKQEMNTDFIIDQELRDSVIEKSKISLKRTIDTELGNEIKRLHLEEDLTGNEISRKLGLGLNAANKWLRKNVYEGLTRDEYMRKHYGGTRFKD